MNNPISVEPLGQISGSDLIEEAIEFAKDLQQPTALSELNSALKGKIVTALVFRSYSQACFAFEDATQLAVSSDERGIRWECKEVSPASKGLSSEMHPILSIDFGGQVGIVEWEIGNLAKSLIGCSMKKLQKSDMGLFVYLDGKRPLLFSPLRMTDSTESNGTLLYLDYAS